MIIEYASTSQDWNRIRTGDTVKVELAYCVVYGVVTYISARGQGNFSGYISIVPLHAEQTSVFCPIYWEPDTVMLRKHVNIWESTVCCVSLYE